MEIIGLALMSIPVILYTTGFFDLNIDDYHLDMIISMGYRVILKRGIVLGDGQIKI